MKKFFISFFVALMILSLTGCRDKVLEETTAAVTAYNEAADAYNTDIIVYNETCDQIKQAVSNLDAAIDKAQAVINAGEDPYDPNTLVDLKSSISEAQSIKATPPVPLQSQNLLALDSEATISQLKELLSIAKARLAEVNSLSIPSIPDIPDYSNNESVINNCLSAYQDSIQSLKQVINPDQDFVIDRLQTIGTITEIEAVTEETDINGLLNKQRGYTSSIYFRDTLVDMDKVYVEEGLEDLINIGTAAGGCIEVYANEDDAKNRDTYLSQFDGTIFASGHYVVGTIIIRTSNALTGTQQLELTEEIKKAFLKVVH